MNVYLRGVNELRRKNNPSKSPDHDSLMSIHIPFNKRLHPNGGCGPMNDLDLFFLSLHSTQLHNQQHLVRI
ncbi:hypothetical protein J1614_001917 [Plenodomus biglobosus]|nr:hypothetical protein J1614_001917 [Plenodomus biglobosus]